MNTNFLKIPTVLVLSVAMTACDLQRPSTTPYAPTTTARLLSIQQQPNTVWDRMASDFTFKSHHNNPRVQLFIKQYTKEESYNLIKFSEHASPYLYHIVQLIEERGLPPELALLPIIESEYRPTATSNRGASGIWQLAPLTGRLYGLKQDQWYDGRKDIDAATKVALNYLQYLYETFDHDWLLALAAYNCGDGRVAAAIRANKKLGKPTDYWSLKLPQETMYFVPKFLSLVYLIKNHRSLDINLAAIPNKQYFDTVKLNKQINLQNAATMAGLDIKEFRKLNPGFRSHVTHPKGPHQIVLPVKHIEVFHNNLAAATKKAAMDKAKADARAKAMAAVNKQPSQQKQRLAQNVATSKTVHTVNRGDTLNLIANRYSTTVKAIKHKNKLTSDIIVSGQKLAI
jgi:membrane-bound lytic murein transglycosylase D